MDAIIPNKGNITGALTKAPVTTKSNIEDAPIKLTELATIRIDKANTAIFFKISLFAILSKFELQELPKF